MIKNLIELVFYFEKDKAAGKPYWRDPTVIALVISLLATELVKYAGVNIDSDLQLKIVGVITGLGALLSPHTGIVAKPTAQTVAQQVQEENRADVDHGAS